ncbi:MAG: hypothetical protein DRP08_06750 [Candidatus Aenigmatarchaeota archaeon]|nr:MAG: hypothetical protein DRP08_06750 [Candidatus Aenigmarchaeota archaeon]
MNPANDRYVTSIVPAWAAAMMPWALKVPVARYSTKIPMARPTSPTLVVTKALMPALAALGSSTLKDISEYEQRPTISQKK